MAQKSLFGRFMGLFHHQQKRGGSTASASEAIDMQNWYISHYCSVDTPIAPPYPEIIKQLYLPQTEIVSAALYYLRQIAANESALTDGIIEDLQNILAAKNKISADHKNLIRQTLQQIRLKNVA